MLARNMKDSSRPISAWNWIAEKTQVLFFTHHQHLVEIAKATLGDAVNCVSLNEKAAIASV